MIAPLRPFLLALSLGAIAAACTDLPVIAAGTCGNGVVEAGEDCDTYAPSGLSCRAPGSAGACRLDCAKDAAGTPAKCPTGWGCGTDAICRQPSGKFAKASELVESGSRKLSMADVDGDGLADVVGTSAGDLLGRSATRVHFFDRSARLSKTSTLPALLSGVSVGDLSGDGLADIVGSVGFFEGVTTFAGKSDRSPSPIGYPALTVPVGSTIRAIGLDVLPDADNPGDEILVFTSFTGPGGKARNELAASSDVQTPLLVLDHEAGELAGKVPIAPLLQGTACQQIVVAFAGAPSVLVYTPCRVEAGKVVYNHVKLDGVPVVPPIEIALPAQATVGAGAFVADMDADKHLDLIIDAGGQTLIAYGDGKGGFFPQKGLMGSPLQAGTLALPDAAERVVAVGQIDGDAYPDLVTPRVIYLTPSKTSAVCPGAPGDTGAACPLEINLGTPWTEAIIADMNRDGFADVIASAKTSNDLQFYGGSKYGLLNLSTISTLANVSQLTLGDFDGDLIADVAFAQAGTHGSPQAVGDALAILFGRPAGPPEPPVLFGRFDRIEDMIHARLAAALPKNADDLGVTSRSEDSVEQTVAIIAGNGDRALLAPFGLQIVAPPMPSLLGSPVGTTLAQIAGESRVDMVAIAYDGAQGPAKADTFRFWLAESQKRGRLGTPIVSERLPPQVQPLVSPGEQVVFLRAGDLDGDGFDEIVYVGLDATAPQHSVVLVASTGGTGTVTVRAPTVLPRFVPPGGHVALADVDADGHLDLVTLTRTVTSDADLLLDPTEVTIFWGVAGGFDVASPTTITPPQAASDLHDLAVVRHGAGGDLAITSEASTLLAVRDGRTFHLVEAALPGGSGIAAGDVDGDGIEDLAIAADGVVRIFRGEAVTP